MLVYYLLSDVYKDKTAFPYSSTEQLFLNSQSQIFQKSFIKRDFDASLQFLWDGSADIPAQARGLVGQCLNRSKSDRIGTAWIK